MKRKHHQDAEPCSPSAFSSTICTLASICGVPALLEEIQYSCGVLKQVQLEAWHVANLHILRVFSCLSREQRCTADALLKIDQSFFYSCCSATLQSTEERDRQEIERRGHSRLEVKHPELYGTLVDNWEARRHVSSYTAVESFVYGDASLNETAKSMTINAENAIALNFRKRLYQYIRFRYAHDGDVELGKQETRALVNSCYRVKTRRECNDRGEEVTVKTNEWDDTTDTEELELRKWLGIVPWPDSIRRHLGHFTLRLFDMLHWMEDFAGQHSNLKGTRLYSLLPHAQSYAAAYMKINASVLQGLCSRAYKRHGQVLLDVPPDQVNHRPLYTNAANRETIMRRAFGVSRLETRNRRFACEVKTNGFGASVLLTRPLTEVEIAERAVNKTSPRKNRRKTSEQAQENEEMYAEEYRRLADGYQPQVLIGVDPGKQNVVTAVIAGRVRPRQRKRGKRPKQRKRQRKRKKRRYQRGERVVQISTREYRHMAMMNKTHEWHENLRKREPWYAGVCQTIPSFKTANLSLFVERLPFIWAHVGFLLAFTAEHAFLRHRFLQDRMKMKVLDAMAKRIVPVPSPQVCVAYGDWSNQAGIKGQPRAPVKGFARALQKRATMVPMDEYKTSKLCSLCHCTLEKARLLATNDDGEFELRKNRNVLRCSNSACRANFWNRDVNAARNILELLAIRLMGLGRIAAFARG